MTDEPVIPLHATLEVRLFLRVDTPLGPVTLDLPSGFVDAELPDDNEQRWASVVANDWRGMIVEGFNDPAKVTEITDALGFGLFLSRMSTTLVEQAGEVPPGDPL